MRGQHHTDFIAKLPKTCRVLTRKKGCGQLWANQGKEVGGTRRSLKETVKPGATITSFEKAAKNQEEIYH